MGPRTKGQRAIVSGLCLGTWPLRSCKGLDGVSTSVVVPTTSHTLEAPCGKQASGSHSINPPAQAACVCGVMCMEGDLKLLVPQDPGHLRSRL